VTQDYVIKNYKGECLAFKRKFLKYNRYFLNALNIFSDYAETIGNLKRQGGVTNFMIEDITWHKFH
jgi:hypothetical protein